MLEQIPNLISRLPLNVVIRKQFQILHHLQFPAMVKFIWAEKAAWMIQKSMGNSFGWCSNWYRAKVAKELKKYGKYDQDNYHDDTFVSISTHFLHFDQLGLRYDDLYDEKYDFDILEALHRLPLQIQDLRNQRLKRAMDCGFKHNYLDKEMQVRINSIVMLTVIRFIYNGTCSN